MNEQELNNQIEANDFADELTDEVLDRLPIARFYCNTVILK